jgi:hypothetical protein
MLARASGLILFQKGGAVVYLLPRDRAEEARLQAGAMTNRPQVATVGSII